MKDPDQPSASTINIDSRYNTVSFYFGRITENPTDANGNPLHIKPIISSGIIAIESDVLVDNAFVRSIERGQNWVLHSFTEAASEWLKAPYLVSFLPDDLEGKPIHKWFDVLEEAKLFAESLADV